MHCSILSLIIAATSGYNVHVPRLMPTVLPRSQRPALIAEQPAVEDMSYRDLQSACKARGLGAKGSTDELRSRLLGAIGVAPASEPATAPTETAAVADSFDDFFSEMYADLTPDASTPPGSAFSLDPLEPDQRNAADLHWLDEIASSEAGPHAELRAEILSASRARKHRQVLAMLGKWRRLRAGADAAVYAAGLMACEDGGAWDVAAALLNELQAAGLAPSAAQYEMAMQACDKAKRWAECLSLLERLRADGLRPSARSFEASIRVCSKAGQHGMVETLWAQLRAETRPVDESGAARQPLLPSTFTYNTLMRSLAEAGGKGAGRAGHAARTASARRVLEAFDEAVDLGVPPDLASFKHALRASDLAGDWRRALRLLEGMVAAGLKPDQLVYGNVMNACARNGHTQTVLRLKREMGAAGLAPNSFCYNAVVSAAARGRDHRLAVSTMEEMEVEAEARGDALLRPTIQTYSAVLRVCAANGQGRTAQQLLGKMREADFAPTAWHYGAAIEACSRSARPGSARQVMGLMKTMQSYAGGKSPLRFSHSDSFPATSLGEVCPRRRAPSQ